MSYSDENYAEQYNPDSFWNKVKLCALKAGHEVLEKALVMYSCMGDPETPGWAKAKIAGALGYFISPVDAIPDITPAVGFADDLGVLTLAFASVVLHIKNTHRQEAKEKMRDWFGREKDDAESSEGEVLAG